MEKVKFNILKNDFLKKIDNTFGPDCLLSPENPFSLDNPDALVRKGCTLYALFIPMHHERENFDHLLRRSFMYGKYTFTIAPGFQKSKVG